VAVLRRGEPVPRSALRIRAAPRGAAVVWDRVTRGTGARELR